MTSPAPVEWRVAPGYTDYATALERMEERAAAVRDTTADELVWLVEHPPLLTAGTSAAADELVQPDRFPVFRTGRGGRYTYHGPGQRVGYVMLDLAARERDVRRYVHALEGWAIQALGLFGVDARREAGRIGIWVDRPDGREAKIGAIGVRVRRWVTLHGFAINVAPDLTHFDAIVPCGLAQYPVTSLRALGISAGLADVDEALAATFPAFLQSLEPVPRPLEALPQSGKVPPDLGNA